MATASRDLTGQLGRAFKGALRLIDRTSELVGKAASFLILFLIFAVVWDVAGRYYLTSSQMWQQTTYGKLLLVYTVFGGAYALANRQHINVDILYGRFSPRVRATLDVATSVLFFVFCFTLLWFAYPPAAKSAARLRLSWGLLSPMNWPTRVMVPVGLVLFMLQGLAKFTRDLFLAVTGKELA